MGMHDLFGVVDDPVTEAANADVTGCRRQSGDRRERTLNDLLCADGYWCVVCGRYLPDDDGVVVHDDVPHPDMTFDEEERPQ